MNLESVNAMLEEESPENLSLRSYDHRGRKLVLAFQSDGGPREDQILLVRFEGVILMHLPSNLYGEVRFRETSEREREQLVPEENYDPYELSGVPGAFTVILLTDPSGRAYGYYLGAMAVQAEWIPWTQFKES